MKIQILFGTESGNAELVADDMLEALCARGVEADSVDMSEGAVDLEADTFNVVVCSTHGEGELPVGAEPFAQWLDDVKPDLCGIRYAIFGLGDSSYENYSRGSEHINERLAALGAVAVGPYGRHDANGRDVASDAAIAWLEDVLAATLSAT